MVAREEAHEKFSDLTNKEFEVLNYYCQGHSYLDISLTLDVSKNYIQKIMGRVLEKLDIRDLPASEVRRIVNAKYCPYIQEWADFLDDENIITDE